LKTQIRNYLKNQTTHEFESVETAINFIVYTKVSNMKHLPLATLGWAIVGSAAVVTTDPPGGRPPASSAKEQGKLFMDTVAPNTKPVAVEEKPRIRADAIRKKLLFGPHVIPAAKVFSRHELRKSSPLYRLPLLPSSFISVEA
jgi:hypothetical protein